MRPRFNAAKAWRHGARRAGPLLTAVGVAIAPLPAASALAPSDPPSVAGIWHMNVSKLMADATVYFVLDPDSSCKQVVRIELLGVTKWTARTCTWRLKGNLLSLSMQQSATPEEEKETATQITVTEVTADSLVVSSDGEAQRWTRANALPAEFQARLQDVSSQ